MCLKVFKRIFTSVSVFTESFLFQYTLKAQIMFNFILNVNLGEKQLPLNKYNIANLQAQELKKSYHMTITIFSHIKTIWREI